MTIVALFDPHAMIGESPEYAQKQTSGDQSEFMGSRPWQRHWSSAEAEIVDRSTLRHKVFVKNPCAKKRIS
jgi:hypothetical protein